MLNWFGTARNKDAIEAIGSLIQAAALIIGGVFAMYQYLEYRADQRVSTALSYADRYYFDDGPVRDARITLEEVWTRERPDLDTAARAGNQNAYAAFVLGVIGRHGLDDEVRETMRFFDAVSLCVSNNLCDADVIRSNLCYEARSFFQLNYVYFQRERRELAHPGYAADTGSLVTRTCQPSG